jgi:hypothetical protein
LNFNTVYPPLNCPFCAQTVSSGVGFRVGALMGKQYRIGDSIVWEGGPTRPESRPPAGNIRSIGYFNCDNIKCPSWSDCFPEVQLALVVVENNVIVAVELHHDLVERQAAQSLNQASTANLDSQGQSGAPAEHPVADKFAILEMS